MNTNKYILNMSHLQTAMLLFTILLLAACDMTPKPEKTVKINSVGLFSAALSEQYALIGTVQGSAELWQLNPKALLHTWQHTDEKQGIKAVAISDDEQYAVTAEKNSFAWWRISNGDLLDVWSLEDIYSVSLSADGQFALIGLKDKAVYFALQYGKTIFAFKHQHSVVASDISVSGKYAITGSRDHTAKLWNLVTGELITSWDHPSSLSAVAIANNDKYALTSASLGQTRLWKIKNGELFKQIGPNLMTLSAVKFSSDNKLLLTGRTSQRIDLWKINTAKLLQYWRPKKNDTWVPSAATILTLAFSHNGQKFYSISSNGYLQRWRK
jgi:WD40 repeat protein